MSEDHISSKEPVSNAELAADLHRYRNNKAGSIYRLLLELKQRRAADDHAFAGPPADPKAVLETLRHEPTARINLTEYQVSHLLDFIDKQPADLTLGEYAEDRKCGDSGEDMPAGLYVWFTEYPEEGQLLLKRYPPEVEKLAAEVRSGLTKCEGRE